MYTGQVIKRLSVIQSAKVNIALIPRAMVEANGADRDNVPTVASAHHYRPLELASACPDPFP